MTQRDRLVILVADSVPIEVGAPSAEFALIELRFDVAGRGSGSVTPAFELTLDLDAGGIRLESPAGEPIPFEDVQRQ